MTDDRTIVGPWDGDGPDPSAQAPRAASDDATLPMPRRSLAGGSQIGPFRIVRILGEGGFGIVYEAEQSKPVKRTVALKLLKPGVATDEVLSRFEGERQALARMEHPSVAKVLDAGVTEDGRPYFAMEFVRGEPILAFADAAQLGIPERLELMIRVCEAIQHAHAKGVVHRDLKPANILCMRTESGPLPKVIDFGIAKATGERLVDSAMVTLGGAMMGTPDYMSPEQADGTDIDTRTDVYSLGATLYELASGLLPFDPAELRSKGLMALRQTVMTQPPLRPSARLHALAQADASAAATIAKARGLTEEALERALRDDIDWICLKCLEKNRERRYDSPGALADDLRRHLRREPVAAGPPTRAYLVRKYVSRHRWGVAAGGVLAATLVASLVTFFVLYREANEQFVRAEKQRSLAEDTLAAFQQSMAAADPATGKVTADMRVPDFLGFVERELDARLAGQPDALASLRTTLGLVQLSFKDRVGSIRLLKPVLDARLAAHRAAPTPDTLGALGDAYHNYGRALFLAESYDDAHAAYSEALRIRRERAGGQDDPDLAMTLQHLASVERMRKHPKEALAHIDESIGMWERIDRFSLDRARAVNNRGVILHRMMQDNAAAERDYLEAVRAMEPRLGPDDLAVAAVYTNLGEIRRDTGRLEQAAADYERALRIKSLRYGPDHEQTKRAEADLAKVRAAAAAKAEQGGP
ncbi:MAG: protein kinase domain-containing protein [Phycisphaerales bacterium]